MIPVSLTVSILALAAHRVLASRPFIVQDEVQTPYSSPTKVPVMLGVMSRCPDAVLCEAVFDQVLKKVGHKVDLSLTFVAQYVLKRPMRALPLNPTRIVPTSQSLTLG